MDSFNEYILAALNKRRLDNTFRSLSINENLSDFSSNDYLGFSKKNTIHFHENAFIIANFAGTGSRLISGNNIEYETLEKKIAEFHNAEASLIFNSGYMANIGLLQAVAKRGDTIIYDKLCHASIRDGIRLSSANAYSFSHNNLFDLEKKIKSAKGKVLVVIESVYSMDGDCSPLVEIADLCEKYNAALVVDEAHAIGVFGKNGEGCVSALGLESKVFARVITFGKALGCHGAAVLGSVNLINFLINFSRPFIYTTALPITTINAIKNAYTELKNSNRLITELHEKINYFKTLITAISQKLIPSQSPIQVILIKDIERCKLIATNLRKQGFFAKEILSPTVPAGTERIRICIHIYNTNQEIENLSQILVNEIQLNEYN